MAYPRFLALAVPVAAAAALLFAAAPASAGKGGGGGGHSGGGHGGGGGYHGGGGYRGGYGYRGYGYGGVGIYLGGYGYGYGYPYYGYGAPYGGYASDYYAPPAAPIYVTPPPVATPGYQFGGDAPPDNTAHVSVRIPADAEVWFGGGKTQQTGAVREFASPPLTPGKEYTYDIKARWMVGGKEVVQVRQVDVSAGSSKSVDFTKPVVEAVDPPRAK